MHRPLFVLLLACSTTAFAADPWVNPANMGANALPTIPAEVPWSNEYTLATIGFSYQHGLKDDHSIAPIFKLTAPFGKWVTAIFDGMPFEAWWSSPRTQVEWALPRTRGIEKADIRFGVKLLLLDIGPKLPKVAFRALTKTTTGKGYDVRRFTDAPGYLLDGLFGQRFQPSPTLLIDLYGEFGFFAWQQGSDRQNDAVHVALGLNVRMHDRLQLEWQWRAYFGWQKKDDRPIVVSLRAAVDVTSFAQLGVTCNLGFLDAPRLDARLDVTFKLPAVVPLILGQ